MTHPIHQHFLIISLKSNFLLKRATFWTHRWLCNVERIASGCIFIKQSDCCHNCNMYAYSTYMLISETFLTIWNDMTWDGHSSSTVVVGFWNTDQTAQPADTPLCLVSRVVSVWWELIHTVGTWQLCCFLQSDRCFLGLKPQKLFAVCMCAPFPNGRVGVIGDVDDFVQCDLQARSSSSHSNEFTKAKGYFNSLIIYRHSFC